MNLSSKTVLIPSIVLLIGTVFGTSATNVFADDPFKNKVEINDDTKQKKECDNNNSGPNSIGCETKEGLTTHTINVQGKKNKVDLDFYSKLKNECDVDTSGQNTIACAAIVDRDIGPINITP